MKNVLDYLTEKNSVALLPHINPDWDAYGSCLALREILSRRGVKCDIVIDEPLPFHLNFLDTDVVIYDGSASYTYEAVCLVDAGELSRVGERAALFEKAEFTACIDHHISDGVGDVRRVVPSAAAAAEVIYDLCRESNIDIDDKIACRLFCALSSDTGSFRYSNTTAHTAEVLGGLLKTGMDIAKMSNLLYYRDTYPQMKLRAAAINAIELYEGGKVGVCPITLDMVTAAGADRGDVSALSSLPKHIYSVITSAVLKEENDGTVKVSFRGDGDVNVREIAAFFGGGGHEKAAGVTIEGTIESVKAMILPHLIEAVK